MIGVGQITPYARVPGPYLAPRSRDTPERRTYASYFPTFTARITQSHHTQTHVVPRKHACTVIGDTCIAAYKAASEHQVAEGSCARSHCRMRFAPGLLNVKSWALYTSSAVRRPAALWCCGALAGRPVAYIVTRFMPWRP